MARKTKNPRKDQVERARARIASGFYDVPEVLDGIGELVGPLLLRDLNNVKMGQGDAYRDAVRRAIEYVWDEVLVTRKSRVEVRNHGTRSDIEFPLRLESIDKCPLLDRWSQDYRMSSIIAEVKNMKRPAAPDDARQLLGNLVAARKGKFGLLISRSGVTDDARDFLKEIALQREYLVLPLSHADLGTLITLRKGGYGKTMEFLRDQHTELTRAA